MCVCVVCVCVCGVQKEAFPVDRTEPSSSLAVHRPPDSAPAHSAPAHSATSQISHLYDTCHLTLFVCSLILPLLEAFYVGLQLAD